MCVSHQQKLAKSPIRQKEIERSEGTCTGPLVTALRTLRKFRDSYFQVEQDDVNAIEDDSPLYYYTYEYDESTAPSDGDDANDAYDNGDDLFDPNVVTDDTEYYYEYSHKAPVPSQRVQSRYMIPVPGWGCMHVRWMT